MSGDLSDQASDVEQLGRDLCIRAARQKSSELDVEPMGICHNCDAPVGLGERFCHGVDCRDDFVKRRNAEIRKGRAQL